jgi:hypothetical protein
MAKTEKVNTENVQPEKSAAQIAAEKKYGTFTSVFGDGEFHPELPKVAFKECIDKTFIMFEAKILRNFKSAEYGTHDAGLMVLAPVENDAEKFTTICSGVVILERLELLIKSRKLPKVCTVIYPEKKYYNLT